MRMICRVFGQARHQTHADRVNNPPLSSSGMTSDNYGIFVHKFKHLVRHLFVGVRKLKRLNSAFNKRVRTHQLDFPFLQLAKLF